MSNKYLEKTMRKFFTILLVCLFVNTAFAQENEPGTFDPTFGTDGTFSFAPSNSHDFVESILVREDGKILTAGRTRTDGTNYASYVSLHNQDGSLDETFGENGMAIFKVKPAIYINGIRDIVLADNGILYAAGYTFDYENNTAFVVALDENGFNYLMFGENGIVETEKGGGVVYESIDIDSQGRIVTAGYIGDSVLVRRYTPAGEMELEINLNPGESEFSNAFAVKVVEDDAIIIAGTQWVVWYDDVIIQKVLVCKFNSDGTIDETFGDNGVLDIAVGDYAEFAMNLDVDNDGNILVVGHSELPNEDENLNLPKYETFIVRLTKNGVIDTTFGESGDGLVKFEAMDGDGCVNYTYAPPVIAPDGQIFGTFYSFNFVTEASRAYAYNLDKDGKLRESFGGSGILAIPFSGDEIRTEALALQNKELIIGGFYWHSEGWKSDIFLSRVFTDIEDVIEEEDAVVELNNNDINIYPNPATSQLFVKSEMNAQVSVIDLTGRCVKLVEATNDVTTVDLKDINKGVYFVMIQNENNRIVEKLIVK